VIVNNSSRGDFCFFDIGGIVEHHCLEDIVSFVDIGVIVDHHCLELIVCFVNNHF
jgi:hypothetical protein